MYGSTLTILVIIVLAYILVGGAIFMELEKDEMDMTDIVNLYFKTHIRNNSCVTFEELDEFAKTVIFAYNSGLLRDSNKSKGNNWDYVHSSFFALTVITSIGYGHISPSSYGGQLFFIFYSIFGIPLCITMLIGMGERLSRPYKNLETSNYFRHHKTTKMLLMILYTLLYFVIFSFIPAAIIMQFEDWTYLQSLYFTVVTLTTVGFGDFVPGEQLQENKAVYKIVTGIWILCGLAWLTMLFHMAVHFVKLVTNKVDAATHHTNTTEDDHRQVPTTSRDEHR